MWYNQADTDLLQDAGYVTEVHHVNGEGDDAGVVYCEMQARENTCEDRTHFHLLQHMYPGRCGYRVCRIVATGYVELWLRGTWNRISR